MTDTTTELESVQELLDKEEKERARAAKKAPRGFDPACVFLLKMNPINLFDPIGREGLRFRCKGCGVEVASTKRKHHHAQHVRAFAKSGGGAYRDTDSTTTPKEETDMTSTTKTTAKRSGTRSSARSASLGTTRAATKSGSAKVAAAKKTAAATAKSQTAKTGTAKSGTATKTGAAKQRADAGKLVAAAAAELKGKAPMSASALADAVCKKDSKLKPFNVAFAIRAAARKGETFKRSNDRPALYSLKG